MAKVKARGIAVYVYRRARKQVEFLQLHRARHVGEYARSWQTVYGGIKKKESAVDAAVRELAEETGLVPQELFQVEYLESFYFRPHDYVMVMPVFAAQVSAAATVTINEEHDAFRWVRRDQLADHFVWRTQREALKIICEDILAPAPARALELLRIDVNLNVAGNDGKKTRKARDSHT